MGRARKPGIRRRTVPAGPNAPAGPKWVEFRKVLFARPGWDRCYFCGHHIDGPDAGEVEHLISPSRRPDLAWDPANLRPTHGGGKRRCQQCGLNCNMVAQANTSERDEQGRSVPFTPGRLAALTAERRRHLAETGQKLPEAPQTGGELPDRGAMWDAGPDPELITAPEPPQQPEPRPNGRHYGRIDPADGSWIPG